MKKFNQVITVEVAVDQIAMQLLETIAPDFKHRELLAESIIGSSLDAGKVSYIYNALNGYNAEINFAVGDNVYCSDTTYQYKDGNGGQLPLGNAVVLQVNEYAHCKLLIEYDHYKSSGKIVKEQKWVQHTDCSRIAAPIEPVQLHDINNAAIENIIEKM